VERVVKRVGPLRLKVPRAVWERVNTLIAVRVRAAREAATVRIVSVSMEAGAARIVMEWK
jgi:hypothetical protein